MIEKEKIYNFPETTGVYKFINKEGVIIYIGKAKNLKVRVSSYFLSSVVGKTKKMMSEAREVVYTQVNSEFEALLLEAYLVRKFMPKYNSALKDDKSPLYVGITREKYPRVITLRRTELNKVKLSKIYGPYTDSKSVKVILRRLRRVFFYGTHKPGRRACINNQIGLCEPCASVIEYEKDEHLKRKMMIKYKNNIKNVQKVLSRKLKKVRKEMIGEMDELSKQEEFELAKQKREQIEMLDYVTNQPIGAKMYLENPNLFEDIRELEMNNLLNIVKKYFKINSVKRIECFDIAHFAGTFPTASMVTFVNGEPDKNYYRHFKIKKAKRADDYGALSEVITRRKRAGWKKANLILVDGGKGQLKTFLKVLGDNANVAGIAKRKETLIFWKDGQFENVELADGPAKHLVQRLRDESHRFARRYHHKLVRNAILKAG